MEDKKFTKREKEEAILLGLVELFIQTGTPIGSQFLKENGFDYLSSATIRNYFNKLEKQGYLSQPHSSGGRLPTTSAYRKYIDSCLQEGTITQEEEHFLSEELKKERKEVAAYIQRAAETLSDISQCAVFLSSPRFDQDFLQDIKLILLEPRKILCILLSNFGLIKTEVLYTQIDIDPSQISSFEKFFLWRIGQGEKPSFEDEAYFKVASRLYNEAIVRHIVNYANFISEEIYRTGLSKLLVFPEFQKPEVLTQSLALFEDDLHMRTLLRECTQKNQLTSWIGSELAPTFNCSILATPYYIHQTAVGAAAILSPMRIPYRHLLGILRVFSQYISDTLTRSIYKFQVSFRSPSYQWIEKRPGTFVQQSSALLEDKSQ